VSVKIICAVKSSAFSLPRFRQSQKRRGEAAARIGSFSLLSVPGKQGIMPALCAACWGKFPQAPDQKPQAFLVFDGFAPSCFSCRRRALKTKTVKPFRLHHSLGEWKI
jgi:hypothetical protein